MRKNPRRILSPQRLPFRHPGTGTTNLANSSINCNADRLIGRSPNRNRPGAGGVSFGLFARVSRRSTRASTIRPAKEPKL
jgi:hypothetical protein